MCKKHSTNVTAYLKILALVIVGSLLLLLLGMNSVSSLPACKVCFAFFFFFWSGT